MGSRNSRVVRNRERSDNGFEWNSNLVKILAGVVIIILIIIVILVVIFKHEDKPKAFQMAENEEKVSYEYFILSAQDNLGVIDKKGNKIIEDIYRSILIPNPQKGVFFCYTEDEKCTILNQNNEKIFSDFEQVETIQPSNETGELEKNVLKYKKENQYGLLDLEGNIITEAIYDEINTLVDKPGALLVKKENQYGILDVKGNIIIEPQYDEILSDGYCTPENQYTKTGYIVSKKAKDGVNFGYIDATGNMLLDVKYERIQRALEYKEDDIYLIVMQKGKKGVFKNKKKIIDLNFQEINYSDLSKIFVVHKNGKYGFFNLQGKAILKPEYTNYSMAGNYISVEKEGKTELFDINGNLVNTSSYTKMIETPNPSYFIAEDENGYYSIISKDIKIDEKYLQVNYAFEHYFIFSDETGKMGVVNALTQEVEIKPAYDFILLIEGTQSLQAIDGIQNLVDIYAKDLTKTVSMKDGVIETLENGYSILYSQTDMKYINSDGQVVPNTEVYPDKKMYAIQKNGKWGFANDAGKDVVQCQYDIVTEFNEYGFAAIKKDGKWGVVDEEGNVILAPTYELDTYYFPKFVGKYRLIESEIIYCEEGETNV